LDDGSYLPEITEFVNTDFNEEERRFFGTVVYPASWYGYTECDFEMIFSEDYMSIESGSVFFKTPTGDGYSEYYGLDHFYYRDLEAQCYEDDDWIDWAENGKFFRVISEPIADWWTAKNICEESGGELAMIFSYEESE